jgi:hypothetical protein
MSLREGLMQCQFWGLELLFALVVLTTLLEIRRLAMNRFVVTGAVALSVLAGVFTATVPPETNRIFYDEQIYQGIGQNLSDLRRAQMCNEGAVEYGQLSCNRWEYNKQPYGYPYLLSIVYRAFGVSERVAFRFNNLTAAATVFVTVALMELLFVAGWGSLLAGLFVALLPMQAAWSNTAASEPSASLLCGAAILAVVHYARAHTGSALAWAIALCGLAMTIRVESMLVIPIAGLAIVLLAPTEFTAPRLWVGAAGGLVVSVLPLLHLFAVRDEGWGAPGPRLSWEIAKSNAPVNFWFYFSDPRFPTVLGIAAVLGLLARARMRERVVLFAYFIAFWTMFVFFYAGSYNYGADVRYSLMTYIPMAGLAALGVRNAGTWLTAFVDSRWIPAGVAAVVLAQVVNYLPLIRATGEEAWAARADVQFAKTFAKQLPPNSIVLTQNPMMFHVWGYNAAQLSIAQTDRPYVNQVLFSRYAGGVYLHWSFWCNVADPVQVKFCQDVMATYPNQLVAEGRERDYRYALYRLSPSSAR